MEVSSEMMDALDAGNDKDVIEVLKQATAGENVIFESELTEDSVDTEIEEIIEIIEEVEEDEQSSQDETTFTENRRTQNTRKEFRRESHADDFAFEGNSSTVKRKNSSRHLVPYDVDEDWQDEEMDHTDESEEELDNTARRRIGEREKSVNNKTTSLPSQTNRLESANNPELSNRDKSRLGREFANDVNNDENVDSNVGHQIVKNVENNLLYTVLGTKKQNSVKSSQSDKASDSQYLKMEQLDENTIPVEGTIYYEGENMDTLYIAQAVEENEQYYNEAAMEEDEQAWEEPGNSDANQNQDDQEEENSQDQIFLHEDEDGQLYFKDDSGALQPVYLTDDGNYAIAETSDDQDSKESSAKSQQSARQSEEESLSVPDSELKPTHSNKPSPAVPTSANDLDNEDNTVTISLIISEDEHGQKRTQVIIPTTDNLKCDICNKSFKTSFQLLRHNRLKHAREEDITTRNFPCDLCPKRYPDQNSLARHRQTHTGDRPFQCLECHKNFPTSTALRRHLTLHNSQSRPLPCIYCGRRFTEKSSLVKHEQSHLAGDQRTHTCDVCQKSFLHSTDLSLHKKYHDPDKKFDCEVCGREFNRLNNLQRHMMVHQQQGANEEILSCDVCGITYKFMSSLTRHMVTTHMNPEKLRQQAEEQRRKRENNYRRYLENRKMYETAHSGGYTSKRSYHHNARILSGSNDEAA